MRFKFNVRPLNKTAITLAMLLAAGSFAAGSAIAQTVTTVNLTAQRMSKTLPDGTTVPMWGYCTNDRTSGGQLLGGGALQSANPCSTTPAGTAAPVANAAWAPGPTIVVPYRNELKIVLNNNIAAGTSTSLVILGQIGGSAGTPTRDAAAVTHAPQTTTTWNANATPPAGPFTPPAQAARARAFAQEAAFGGSVTYTWNSNISSSGPARYLKPGTYLYETGSHPSLQAPMGLYGVLVVTDQADDNHHAYPGAYSGYPSTSPLAALANVPYRQEAKLLFSEIDAVQNAAVDAAAVAKTSESIRWNDPQCLQSQQSAPAGYQVPCYPAAVNYAPTYFLVNGQPYDQSNPGGSSVAVATTESAGGMLVRLVNAGSRTHVPAFVGQTLSLIAEDGNVAPGTPKIQSEVNMPAAKTIDALLKPNSGVAATYRQRSVVAFFDRELGLSSGNQVKGGLQGYLVFTNSGATGAALGALLNQDIQAANLAGAVAAAAKPDTYTLSPNAGTFAANVLANDISVTNTTISGGTLVAGTTSTSLALTYGSVVLNTNGSFTWTASTTTPPTTGASETFNYCGLPAGAATCALVTLNFQAVGGPPTAIARVYDNSATTAYPSNVASLIKVPGGAGLLAGAVDPNNFPMTAAFAAGTQVPSWVALQPDGSFVATPCATTFPATCTFSFVAVNSQGTASAPVSATVIFPAGSGLSVNLIDAVTGVAASGGDYGWIIEEDQTFHNATPGVTPPYIPGTVPPPSLATSFHRSHSPIIAAGCTGPLSCSDAQSFGGGAATPNPRSFPADVVLDPTKYYYISILPGDAANPTVAGASGDPLIDPNCGGKSPAACGHTMSGTSIAPLAAGATGYAAQTVKLEPNPLKPSQLSIYIFEDSAPTNGDPDALEHGLGGFEIIVNDVAGRSGDPIGQITYDAFNMPLTNALLGTPGCPNDYSPTPTNTANTSTNKYYAGKDLTGVVITCPNDPKDPTGNNPSPAYALQGMALIKNIMPGRFDVIAHAGAAREGAGEKWFQVSTLEGTPGQDAFSKAGEPAYFQEFGPPGFHTFIGFLNPGNIAIQNIIATHPTASAAALESGESLEQLPNGGGPALPVTTVSGRVTSLHMSRPIMETMWDSASRDPLAQTTCFVGLNQAGETGMNIAFTACDPQGNFVLNNIPVGSYMLVIWDQWLDQIIAYKSVEVTGSAAAPTTPTAAVAMGDIPVFSWFTRLETNTFADTNNNGIRDNGEPGIAQVPVTVRFRDGSVSNRLLTDSDGNAVFSELFPLFNWYVVESDRTRFAGTGVNVTVDAGGLPDCVTNTGTGTNTLSTSGSAPSGQPCSRTGGILNSSYVWTNPVTGTVYGAMPSTASPGTGSPTGTTATGTNRIDPGSTLFEGLQGYINQTQILDWGKRPFNPGENGGIQGMVIYASTRGFDDPSLEVQFMWEPGVPRVKINLYQEKQNADGTTGLVLVDSTLSTSWDDFANGTTAAGAPNLVCPGQDGNDPFLTYTLGTANQFKCYDGFHLWNQVQPAVYDGTYKFPTAACAICTNGTLPNGKYVVESVLPPGYETVKEQDKNILIGDAWVAPVAVQFGTLTNLFIMPDQASVLASYNPNNANNQTTALGFTGAKTQLPACVGLMHTVPDFMSLFPNSGLISPFAGAQKPLCDRKEVALMDQMTGNSNFFVFSTTPRASHFTGLILDDAATEINAASPDFGEKFAIAYAPVSLKDFNGVEVSRVYSDQWGTYNGVIYSSWQVNVPNPAGYSPNMLVTCMNDPGPILDTRVGSATNGQWITDPLYNPSFSNFCYTNPFMPGLTVYLDTPVLPVAAFADGYNPPDCAYPDTTPAISRVDGDAIGPWVAAADGTHTITIKSRGNVDVPNPSYQGPSANTAPFNSKTVTRHYGFGSAPGTVQIGSVALTNVSWSDGVISGTVPMGASTGELKIVSANGLSSVDTVTVTIESTKPVIVEPVALNAVPGSVNSAGIAHPIQNAIDAAKPGDLIIVDAGSYPELVIMWKPVRLQGVGAASAVINAAKYPTQKLEDWRPVINKLFGINATVTSGNNATADNATIGELVANPQVDPLPTQTPISGGIILLEPTILATEEGAGVTVLAKNLPQSACGKDSNGNYLNTTANSDSAYYQTTATNNGIISAVAVADTGWKMGDSNFLCAPSRIDGLGITGSDAGGGIYANGWAHNLEIANNQIYGNASAMHGGIRVASPFEEELPPGLGYNYDVNVNIHHNSITKNGTVEATPGVANTANQTGSGAAVSICTGTDNYQVNYNFICGNYSNGNGGGIGVLGASLNGVISHNSVLFNQSYQQMANVHGGGISVEGDQTTAGNLSNGTGNVLIDSNLIVGNFAQAGHGGGIQLAHINGNEVLANPSNPNLWYKATVRNNIITDNVAGYSGGGIYLVDTLNAAIYDNTIANNDSVGIVGSLFGTGGRGPTTAFPSVAGISTDLTSNAILAALPASAAAANQYSVPVLFNDIIWHNRSFFLDARTGVTNLCSSSAMSDAGANCVVLAAQTAVGQCANLTTGTAPAYWDLGAVGDSSAAAPAVTLATTASVLSTSSTDPGFVNGYCNGSRANPAFKFEPGQPFLPPFSLAAGITLDEAGNFADLRFGPLQLDGDYHLTNAGAAYANGTAAANGISAAPIDFDGMSRPDAARVAGANGYDVGALQYNATHGAGASVTVTPSALTFATGNVSSQLVTVLNTGAAPVHFATAPISVTNIAATPNAFSQANNCGVTLASGSSCQITVTFAVPAAATTGTLTVSFAANQGANVPAAVSVALTGQATAYTVSPLALTFASQAVGSTSPAQSVTVTNTGASALPIANIALGGASPFQFAQTNTCGTSLAPTAVCTINVTFAPAAIATVGATLTVTPGGGAAATTVTLTGTGGKPSLTKYTLLPSAVNFGAQMVLTPTATPQILTLSNIDTVPLTMAGFAVTGANAADFKLTPSAACGASLAAGTQCTLSVVFTPAAGGARSATVVGPDPAQAVSLTGSGVAPTFTLSPSPATFGAQLVGSTSAPTVITLTNTSPATISLATVGDAINGANGGSFAVSSNSCTAALPLASGASCTLGVTFAPPAAGANRATLDVTAGSASSPATPVSVALVGTGIAPIASAAPAQLTYGNTLVGTTSAAQTVTISNPGTAPLFITGIGATGANAGEFVVGADSCPINGAGLPANASCTVAVTFQPTSSGAASAALNVSVTAPATSPALPLAGTAIAPVLTISQTSIAFGNVPVCANGGGGCGTASVPFTISNTGTAPLRVTGLTTTGTGYSVTFTGLLGFTLQPNASRTVNVRYTANAAGAGTQSVGSLAINVAAPAASATVPLTATSTVPALTVAPNALNFASTLNTRTIAQTVTVTSSGSAPLTINSVNLGGNNPGQFAMTSTCPAAPATLAAGSNCTVSVSFRPTSRSTPKTATLSVNVGSPAQSTQVALSGAVQ